MFHVTDTRVKSVSLAIHTIGLLMFVFPSNAVMMLRRILVYDKVCKITHLK